MERMGLKGLPSTKVSFYWCIQKRNVFVGISFRTIEHILSPLLFSVSFLGFVGIFLAIRRFYFSMETYVKTPKMGMIDSPKLLNVLPYRLLKDYSDYRVCGIIFFPPHFTNLCISPFSWLWIFFPIFFLFPRRLVRTLLYQHLYIYTRGGGGGSNSGVNTHSWNARGPPFEKVIGPAPWPMRLSLFTVMAAGRVRALDKMSRSDWLVVVVLLLLAK